MPGPEISIQTWLNPSSHSLVFGLMVHNRHILTMAINSGLPATVISPSTRDALIATRVLLATNSSGSYRLTGLAAEGQRLPDLEARVVPRLSRLGVNGMVGLDFLFHFEHVHFHVPTLRLILQNPTNGPLRP
jgi:hypothetical protein